MPAPAPGERYTLTWVDEMGCIFGTPQRKKIMYAKGACRRVYFAGLVLHDSAIFLEKLVPSVKVPVSGKEEPFSGLFVLGWEVPGERFSGSSYISRPRSYGVWKRTGQSVPESFGLHDAVLKQLLSPVMFNYASAADPAAQVCGFSASLTHERASHCSSPSNAYSGTMNISS